MRIVCVKCGLTLKTEKVGVVAQENLSHKGDPYKIWQADMLACPECGYQVLAGFGENPLYRKFNDKDFLEAQKYVTVEFI